MKKILSLCLLVLGLTITGCSNSKNADQDQVIDAFVKTLNNINGLESLEYGVTSSMKAGGALKKDMSMDIKGIALTKENSSYMEVKLNSIPKDIFDTKSDVETKNMKTYTTKEYIYTCEDEKCTKTENIVSEYLEGRQDPLASFKEIDSTQVKMMLAMLGKVQYLEVGSNYEIKSVVDVNKIAKLMGGSSADFDKDNTINTVEISIVFPKNDGKNIDIEVNLKGKMEGKDFTFGPVKAYTKESAVKEIVVPEELTKLKVTEMEGLTYN